MSREGKLVKNTLILSLGTFFPKLVSVITLPILTSYLTKSEYGTYDLVITLASFLLPVITLQIQSAAFRFLIECRDDREQIDRIVTNIMAFTIPTSTVALCVLYIFLPGLSPVSKLLVCAYCFVDILYAALQQTIRGLSFNFSYSVSAITISLINLILTVLLVWAGSWGLNGVLVAMVASYAFGCLTLALKARKYVSIRLKLVSVKTIKELLAYSWPMVFNNLSNWILRLSDRLVITAFLGIEANAVYAVANKIPNLIVMVQNTFSLAWQENASIVSKDDDADAYYSGVFDSMYSIITGFTSLLIAFTPLLFAILIGGDYDEAYYQMPILFMGIMFCCLSSFQSGIYVAYKKTKQVGITTIMAAVCHLVLDLLLVKVLGITAGSISTLISYLLLMIYRMYDLRKTVIIKYNYKKMIAVVAILAVMCVISVIRTTVFDIINLIIGCALFLVLNRHLLMAILQKIKSKLKKA